MSAFDPKQTSGHSSARRAAGSQSLFNDLPERVLFDHLAVTKRVEIATTHCNPLSRCWCTRQGPLGDPHVPVDIVGVVSVVHIRQALKPPFERLADRCHTFVAIAPWMRPPRHFEDSVVS